MLSTILACVISVILYIKSYVCHAQAPSNMFNCKCLFYMVFYLRNNEHDTAKYIQYNCFSQCQNVAKKCDTRPHQLNILLAMAAYNAWLLLCFSGGVIVHI